RGLAETPHQRGIVKPHQGGLYAASQAQIPELATRSTADFAPTNRTAATILALPHGHTRPTIECSATRSSRLPLPSPTPSQRPFSPPTAATSLSPRALCCKSSGRRPSPPRLTTRCSSRRPRPPPRS